MSLFRKWGFGAELKFSGGKAISGMTKAKRAVQSLRGAFTSLRGAGADLGAGVQSLTFLLAPLGVGLGIASARASSLAGNLEAQTLTMRILLGDLDKANDLLGKIRKNAASTPFQEGDLIEGSKRLLRLTGDNVDKNIELLVLMETMAALNPGKSVVDAVEGLLDATSGGGFERLKEFGLSFRAEDFKKSGRPGGQAWAEAVVEAIKNRMAELTRGEDLVGALSKTFSGRLSTLQDAVDNALKGIGKRLNEAIGPALVEVTDFINNEFAPDFIAGFELAMDRTEAVWQAKGRPVIDDMLARWRALDSGMRQRFSSIAGMAAIGVTALLPLAGVLAVTAQGLGALGLFVSGAVGGLSALFSVASAGIAAVGAAATFMTGAFGTVFVAAGTLTSLISGGLVATILSLFGVMSTGVAGFIITMGTLGAAAIAGVVSIVGVALVGAFLAAAAGAVVLGVAVGGVMATLAARSQTFSAIALMPQVMADSVDKLSLTARQMGAAWQFAFGTFMQGARPMVEMLLDRLQPAMDSTIDVVVDIMEEFARMGLTTQELQKFGQQLANVLLFALGFALDIVGSGVEFITAGLKALAPVMVGMIQFARRLAVAFFGVNAGTLSARDGFTLLVLAVSQNLVTMVSLVARTILTVVSAMVGQLAALLARLPGGGGLVGAALDFGATATAGLATKIDEELRDVIATIDKRALDIENKRAEAATAATTVTVTPEVAVKIEQTTKVCIDEKEIGKAEGAKAARAGERGTGPALPAQQRGRVLRRGLVVTPLSPSEAF